MRQGRHWAARARVISPAFSSTLRCLEDSGHAHLKGLGELADGGIAGHQMSEDGTASGISECGKGGGKVVDRHFVFNPTGYKRQPGNSVKSFFGSYSA